MKLCAGQLHGGTLVTAHVSFVQHSDLREAAQKSQLHGVALVTADASSVQHRDVREAAMATRRADRQKHHHSQIWTKGFHGGPYRKVVLPQPAYDGQIEDGCSFVTFVPMFRFLVQR